MLKLSYDLHIHSCLSPCGSEDMTPANIVNMAKLKELDVIAVTDHNSSKNCPAVLKLAEELGIVAIPGMELCTLEEVHVLCLFATLQDALEFESLVYSKLVRFPNNETVFGKQEIYDENDNLIGNEPYLLINATELSFDSLDEIISRYHGVYIPAHIDKSSNSLISNLGFIPPDSSFVCAELKSLGRREELIKQHPYLLNCNIITNSDAHDLEIINEPVNFILSEDRTREAIIKALSTHKIML